MFCIDFAGSLKQQGLKGSRDMKTYEVIHEIFNQCPGNHSRDNFIQEVEMENPEVWLHAKFKSEKELRMEKTEKEDGSVVYDVMIADVHQRFTFSEI